MTARRFVAFVLVFVAGMIIGHFVRPPDRPRVDAHWPTEQPYQLALSYPESDGRTNHILRVNRVSTIHPSTTFDSSAWRVTMTTTNGVWFMECDQTATDFAR